MAWNKNPNGVFSVGSFRRALEDFEDTVSIPAALDIFLVWRGVCPPKIEVFMWQLLRSRIPVKGVLSRFGFKPSDGVVCSLCCLEEESIDHLFLRCSWSWKLWSKCLSWWGVVGCVNDSLQNWFLGWDGCCPSVSQRRAWRLGFLATVWTIWEQRNRAVFDGAVCDLVASSDLIKFRVAWWFKYHGKGSSDSITSLVLNISDCCKDVKAKPAVKKNFWIPPDVDSLSFNVDGSARGSPGLAGIGGVLRDFKGKVLCTFSSFVGNQLPVTAEVLAILRACQLSASLSSRKETIAIISDSKVVVSWVNGDGLGDLDHLNFIMEIKEWMKTSGNVSVIFKSRVSNSLADSLARKAVESQADLLEWSLD